MSEKITEKMKRDAFEEHYEMLREQLGDDLAYKLRPFIIQEILEGENGEVLATYTPKGAIEAVVASTT